MAAWLFTHRQLAKAILLAGLENQDQDLISGTCLLNPKSRRDKEICSLVHVVLNRTCQKLALEFLKGLPCKSPYRGQKNLELTDLREPFWEYQGLRALWMQNPSGLENLSLLGNLTHLGLNFGDQFYSRFQDTLTLPESLIYLEVTLSVLYRVQELPPGLATVRILDISSTSMPGCLCKSTSLRVLIGKDKSCPVLDVPWGMTLPPNLEESDFLMFSNPEARYLFPPRIRKQTLNCSIHRLRLLPFSPSMRILSYERGFLHDTQATLDLDRFAGLTHLTLKVCVRALDLRACLALSSLDLYESSIQEMMLAPGIALDKISIHVIQVLLFLGVPVGQARVRNSRSSLLAQLKASCLVLDHPGKPTTIQVSDTVRSAILLNSPRDPVDVRTQPPVDALHFLFGSE